jgi:protein-tyrosine-phosphatase
VPIVLFLCVHNAGRSQMALGWLERLAGGRVVGWSGGSEPAGEVNPAAVEAMREVGISLEDEFPKPWTDEIVRAAGRYAGSFDAALAELDHRISAIAEPRLAGDEQRGGAP